MLLLLLTGAPVPAAAQPEPEERRVLAMDAGRWIDLGRAGPGASLRLDLLGARAEVVTARADHIEVWIAAIPGGADLSRLSLRLTRAGGVLVLEDIYPRRTSLPWDECLPPSGERGDVWAVPGGYRLTIRAPRQVRVAPPSR